jgi:hypothetical protein
MTRSSVSILFAWVAATSVAHANVEIGRTAGIHVFSSRSELGVADQPDGPSQRSSLLAGLRIGVYFVQMPRSGCALTSARAKNRRVELRAR